MGRHDLREHPALGGYCCHTSPARNPPCRNPVAGVRDSSHFLVARALCSLLLCWACHRDTAHPESLKRPCGREDIWEEGGEGRLPRLKSAPKSHQRHQWYVASGATREPPCPCVTWTPGMLALWGLQPLQHVWRKLKAGALLSPVLRDSPAASLGACWQLLGGGYWRLNLMLWKGNPGLALPSRKLNLHRSEMLQVSAPPEEWAGLPTGTTSSTTSSCAVPGEGDVRVQRAELSLRFSC